MTPNIDDIEAARRRLQGILKPTPLLRSATLDRMLEAEVFLKPENLQKTGSFKIRGAYNRVTTLNPEEAARGVIAASAGNHGQALAYAASHAGIKATIVMPRTAAIAKIDATRGYGQQVVLEGIDYPAARLAAETLCARTGAIFVDAYDDPFVIAGQGTVGLEIADEIAPDVVIVPVGGGGLIAGIASAVPPAMAAIGPTSIPSRMVVSNERSAARKFGTVTRTHTPSVSGKQIIATSKAFCRIVLCGVSSRFLKLFDRASELDTAAATPNSTSSVIRISFGSICVTSLLYPFETNTLRLPDKPLL